MKGIKNILGGFTFMKKYLLLSIVLAVFTLVVPLYAFANVDDYFAPNEEINRDNKQINEQEVLFYKMEDLIKSENSIDLESLGAKAIGGGMITCEVEGMTSYCDWRILAPGVKIKKSNITVRYKRGNTGDGSILFRYDVPLTNFINNQSIKTHTSKGDYTATLGGTFEGHDGTDYAASGSKPAKFTIK